MNELLVLHFSTVLVQCYSHFISRTRDWYVHRHPCFFFSIHLLHFVSLTWHHCRNTCWFGNSYVIDCFSRVFGCWHILCYGAWWSFVQSIPVTSLVLCFASCASLAGLLVLFFFAEQFVRLLLWFRSSHCPLQFLKFLIVHLFFSPCGYFSYIR